MSGNNVQEVNELSFDEQVLASDIPVLVDFAASWCGPCKAIAPLVGQVADEYLGKAKVVTLDIDDNSTLAQRYGIRGVPTLYVFKSGEIVGKIVGAVPKQRMIDLLQPHVS